MVCVCVLRGSHNIQTISKPALGTQFGKCVYKCLFAVVGFHETDNSMKQYFNKWLRSLVFFSPAVRYIENMFVFVLSCTVKRNPSELALSFPLLPAANVNFLFNHGTLK